MGLTNETCDSCGDQKTVLVPLAVLDELPSGGMKMVIKYYCSDCAETMLEDANEIDDDKDDEEEENEDTPSGICECCGKTITVREGETIEEYYCFGCEKYICERCSLALQGIGRHTIKDHKEACKEAGNHISLDYSNIPCSC